MLVAGLAVGTIAIVSYEIYKAAKGIKEVADTPDDFSIYTGLEDEY